MGAAANGAEQGQTDADRTVAEAHCRLPFRSNHHAISRRRWVMSLASLVGFATAQEHQVQTLMEWN